jgi:hypothetical protein
VLSFVNTERQIAAEKCSDINALCGVYLSFANVQTSQQKQDKIPFFKLRRKAKG